MENFAAGIYDGFKTLATIAIIGLILLPLGIWKLVDIIIWLIHHLSITLK